MPIFVAAVTGSWRVVIIVSSENGLALGYIGPEGEWGDLHINHHRAWVRDGQIKTKLLASLVGDAWNKVVEDYPQ